VAQSLVLTIAGGALAGGAAGPFGAADAAPAFGGPPPAQPPSDSVHRFGSPDASSYDPVFGLGAFAVEAQRVLSRASSGGLASPPGMASAGAGAGTSGSGAASQERATGKRRLDQQAEACAGPAFDPLAMHRLWCPWAHAAAAAHADGAEGSGGGGASDNPLGRGWLHCLQALSGGSGPAPDAGGGSSTDYGARVRQALESFRGA
jgi:hypothetical protein